MAEYIGVIDRDRELVGFLKIRDRLAQRIVLQRDSEDGSKLFRNASVREAVRGPVR